MKNNGLYSCFNFRDIGGTIAAIWDVGTVIGDLRSEGDLKGGIGCSLMVNGKKQG